MLSTYPLTDWGSVSALFTAVPPPIKTKSNSERGRLIRSVPWLLRGDDVTEATISIPVLERARATHYHGG